MKLRAVIVDWGGVMTGPLPDTVRAWIAADNIDYGSYATVMRTWVTDAYQVGGAVNPIHALERGECTDAEFEQLLAAQITCRDGRPVVAAGLLDRMFAATELSDPMHDLVRAVRATGLRTGLLSNSWGVSAYPSHLFPGLFDAVVISAEVGMRKPEERIFQHAASLLGVDARECVFIDDIEENIRAAEAVGLVGVLHRNAADTTARIRELLGISV